MLVQKYGLKRGKQQYLCKGCGHQFVVRYSKKSHVLAAYKAYSEGKQTLSELSEAHKKSSRTLQRTFDKLTFTAAENETNSLCINLLLDATFFSRRDGVLIFRAQKKNLHWRFIETESLTEIALGLDMLDKMGYQFKSVTIDGRRGVIQLFLARYPEVPIQLCQFHQTQIVRRYTTNRPKTPCGRALKALMTHITELDEEAFSTLFFKLQEEFSDFLKERNEQDQFKHRQLRSAFRSIKSNLPYLFTYKKFPELNIPNTTNSCDGSFAHWKQKIKIHRGLRKHRRNKMIGFLLSKT